MLKWAFKWKKTLINKQNKYSFRAFEVIFLCNSCPNESSMQWYIRKPKNTSSRISLCILVILYVEMRKQKYKTQVNWNTFLVLLCLFFNTIRVLTARECKDYNTNLRNTLFQKNSVCFGDFMLKWDYKCHKTWVN
jgi:hypothetical protein